MRDLSRTGTGAVGDHEEGSVLLLTLGYVLLALAVIFVCVCATDLYIAQKRLDALADSAALAGAPAYDGGMGLAASCMRASTRSAMVPAPEAASRLSRVTSGGAWVPPGP